MTASGAIRTRPVKKQYQLKKKDRPTSINRVSNNIFTLFGPTEMDSKVSKPSLERELMRQKEQEVNILINKDYQRGSCGRLHEKKVATTIDERNKRSITPEKRENLTV
jgi:hypothetical protein